MNNTLPAIIINRFIQFVKRKF